jgi:hypothetical protein
LHEKHFHPVSVQLSAPVWNLLALPDTPMVVMEQRDEIKRLASFSLYDYVDKKFLWQDVVLTEKWWINLVRVTPEWIVLQVFESTENPDNTSLRFITVKEGRVVTDPPDEKHPAHTNDAEYPFQYLAGEPDFDTVKKFLTVKFDVTPVLGVEYLEYADRVFISYYVGNPAAYTNKLAIVTPQGNCLYEEEIGTNLRGIGINTFFISSGYLFFVKNKTELVTFRIV